MWLGSFGLHPVTGSRIWRVTSFSEWKASPSIIDEKQTLQGGLHGEAGFYHRAQSLSPTPHCGQFFLLAFVVAYRKVSPLFLSHLPASSPPFLCISILRHIDRVWYKLFQQDLLIPLKASFKEARCHHIGGVVCVPRTKFFTWQNPSFLDNRRVLVNKKIYLCLLVCVKKYMRYFWFLNMFNLKTMFLGFWSRTPLQIPITTKSGYFIESLKSESKSLSLSQVDFFFLV